jgi:hypothetical protein
MLSGRHYTSRPKRGKGIDNLLMIRCDQDAIDPLAELDAIDNVLDEGATGLGRENLGGKSG